MSAHSRIATLVAATLLCSSLVHASEELTREESSPLITDRPDQTESTATVPKGWVQLEMGLKRDGDEVEEDLELADTLGSALLRIGLSRKVELRLGWNGIGARDQREGSVERRINGIGDANLGVKIRLAREEGRRPGIAIIPGVSVPIGDDDFSSEGFDPGVLLAFSHSFSERVGLGYNAGLIFESEEPLAGDRRTLSTWAWSLASGVALSDKIGSFVEIFGSVPASASGSSTATLDAGFTWLVRPNIQLDASAGLGLTDSATDWFVSAGFSVRLPR